MPERDLPSLYYTFIGSLPTFPASLETAKNLPITAVRLEGRLAGILNPHDHATVHTFEKTLFGFNYDSDDDYLERARNLLDQAAEVSPHVVEACRFLIEQRLLIGLLRRQLKGKDLPHGFDENWAPFLSDNDPILIKRNWKQPCFNLMARHPWMKQMYELIQNDEAIESERLLTSLQWDVLSDLNFQSGFDFSAVILYVLKWHVMRQWVSHMPEESLELINSEVNKIVEQTEIRA